MPDTIQIDSPALTDDELKDVKDFYSHPENHRVGTLKELLEELHNA